MEITFDDVQKLVGKDNNRKVNVSLFRNRDGNGILFFCIGKSFHEKVSAGKEKIECTARLLFLLLKNRRLPKEKFTFTSAIFLPLKNKFFQSKKLKVTQH